VPIEYDDAVGGYPPMGLDAAALQWPWDVPPVVAPPVDVVAQPPVAVDPSSAAGPPPPVDDQLAGAPGFMPPDTTAAVAPPPIPPPPAEVDLAPPMPDAISGGALPSPAPPPPFTETTAEQEAREQERLNRLAIDDPQQFAEVTAQNEAERQKFVDARRLEIINRDHAEQQANLKRRLAADKATQATLEQVQDDARRIAATKIDPTGGVHGLGRLGFVVASFLGGLVQDRNGGRNVGLDALNDAISRGIEAQKADLVNQREGIGHRNSTLQQELARHGDTFQAEEAVRLAALKHADDLLSIEQQNYNSRGTTALRIAGLRAGIQRQQLASIDAFRSRDWDRKYKLLELQDKADARAAAALKDQHDQALGWANHALSAKRFNYEQGKDAADFNLRAGELADKRDDKARQDDRELSLGALPRLRVDEKGAPALDENGLPVVESGPLTQKDGKLYRAPDAPTRKELAAKTLAASEVTDMINEVLDIRDKTGGESGVFNSDARQRLEVLQNRLVILQKSGTQGMSSDEDMKKLSAAVGADDIASFRARAAGLQEGRDRTVTELNKAYRIANYTGPKIEFPNPYGKAAGNTSQDDADQALLEKPKGGFAEDLARELDRRTTGLSPEQLRAFGPRIAPEDIESAGYSLGAREPDPRLRAQLAAKGPQIGIPLTPAQRAAFDDVAARFDPGASTEQQRRIDELADQARGDGADATKARALLTKVSTSAHTVRLRELAKSALERAVSTDVLGGDDPGLSLEPVVRGTAHETIPPLRRR